MKKIKMLVLLAACGVAACGTFKLGIVHPQAGKTADQQQLDTLTCKDQAELAVNSAGHQTGDFLMGLTIVGAPVAYEMDKKKERQVFAECMKGRGYVVTPPDGSAPAPKAAAATTTPVPAAPTASMVPGTDQLGLALLPGFEMKSVPDNLKSVGAVLYAVNRTLDMAMMVVPVRHEGITDLMAFASTKKAGQLDRVTDATSSEVTHLTVHGHNATRFSVTGTYKNLRVTYVTTLIEGRDQIVIVSAWTGASNAQQQMTVLESLADGVSGIS
jgi:hypothetical protein